jgi:hypothetical protein
VLLLARSGRAVTHRRLGLGRAADRDRRGRDVVVPDYEGLAGLEVAIPFDSRVVGTAESPEPVGAESVLAVTRRDLLTIC